MGITARQLHRGAPRAAWHLALLRLVLLRPALLLPALALLTLAPASVPARTRGDDSTPGREQNSSFPQSAAALPDTVRHWYDTLDVLRPRFARATHAERLALAAFTALALPVGLSVGATTIVPPMVNFLVEEERLYVGITTGTGLGFGGDTMQVVYWPDLRMQFDIGYYFARERPIIVHASVVKDLWLSSIHDQDLMAVGAAIGAGVATDAHAYSPYLEGAFGFANPLGIRYAPLFPMHNYGIRGRLGYHLAAERTWYEVSFGVTSTFGR